MFPLKDNIPTDRTPIVTIALILANVLVYFLWQRGGLSFGSPSSGHYLRNLIDYGAIPYELTHPGKHCDFAGGVVSQSAQIACEGQRGVSGQASSQPSTWITPFTAMFMHGGLLHLGGNMLFLWIFGNNVEDAMGRVKFIVFYLLGGLAAFALQVAVGTSSTVPTLGASGAIAAVLGGYLLLYPRARVLTAVFIIFFFTLLELPAIFFLGIWFLQQALFGAYDLTNPTGGEGGVAYFAHIGGFAFGLALIKTFASRRKEVGPRFPVY
jgi:membrane associated rhomboid family serine protease